MTPDELTRAQMLERAQWPMWKRLEWIDEMIELAALLQRDPSPNCDDHDPRVFGRACDDERRDCLPPDENRVRPGRP